MTKTFKAKLEAANENLRRSAEDAKMRCVEMEARLSETGVIQVGRFDVSSVYIEHLVLNEL